MFDPSELMLSILFGLLGTAYFIYGKKRTNFVFLISGVVLCIFPYFVTEIPYQFGIGLALLALPFVLKEG